MMPADHIRHLRRQEIDSLKWDACIASAPNGLIYARTFYLDEMTSGQWDALVFDDYRAVMPLTWNRKFGFYYLYQPFCTPCLGVFGDGFPVSAFLQAIPRKFKYWDIDLNEANGSSSEPAITASSVIPATRPLRITTRANQLLRLDREPEEMERYYNRLARRMCKGAREGHLDILRDVGPRDVIDLYRKEYGGRHPRLGTKDYERLTSVAEKAFLKKQARTYLALWPDGAIAAFYLVLSDDKFVYSTLGGSTQKGKEISAFYLLTDAAIKDHAGSGRVFRFEGSDIPGIASFNASFGSTPVYYPHLLMNDLPFPVNMLKNRQGIYQNKHE